MTLHHPEGAILLKQQTLIQEDNTLTQSALYRLDPSHPVSPQDLHQDLLAHQAYGQSVPVTTNRPSAPTRSTRQGSPAALHRDAPAAQHRDTPPPRKLPQLPRIPKPTFPDLPGNTQVKVLATAIGAGIIAPILWKIIQSLGFAQ